MILDDSRCSYMIVDETIEGRDHAPRWFHSISNYQEEQGEGRGPKREYALKQAIFPFAMG